MSKLLKPAACCSVGLLISLALSGCGDNGHNYPDLCETKEVQEWVSLYACDSPVPEFASSDFCSPPQGVEFLQSCAVCGASEGDGACTTVKEVYSYNATDTFVFGAKSDTCGATTLATEKTTYMCDFLSDGGCYELPGCDEDDYCNYAQFTDPMVHGCEQRWAEVKRTKRICYCEGRPYMVGGSSLAAAEASEASSKGTAESTQGGSCEDRWGVIQRNISITTADAPVSSSTGLASRLVQEALRAHAEKLDGGIPAVPKALYGVEGTKALEADLPGLLSSARRELAESPTLAADVARWRRTGLAEHAAVAAFAKLCLELLVVGAPPRLVRLSVEAQAEELLHAHIALGLSTVEDIGGPGGPPEEVGFRLNFPEHALQLKRDFASLGAAAVREGLLGEGRSALNLFSRALLAHGGGAGQGEEDGLSEPNGSGSLGRLLWAMAMDEARHAELAEETLLWLQREAGMAMPDVTLQGGDISVGEKPGSLPIEQQVSRA